MILYVSHMNVLTWSVKIKYSILYSIPFVSLNYNNSISWGTLLFFTLWLGMCLHRMHSLQIGLILDCTLLPKPLQIITSDCELPFWWLSSIEMYGLGSAFNHFHTALWLKPLSISMGQPFCDCCTQLHGFFYTIFNGIKCLLYMNIK